MAVEVAVAVNVGATVGNSVGVSVGIGGSVASGCAVFACAASDVSPILIATRVSTNAAKSSSDGPALQLDRMTHIKVMIKSRQRILMNNLSKRNKLANDG